MTTPQLNIDEQLACYRLLLEEKWKEVEWWNDWKEKWTPFLSSNFNLSKSVLLRRKPAPPQPKYRPWRDAGEVPLGAWLRRKGNQPVWLMVGYAEGNVAYSQNSETTVESLVELFEHSLDHGKTWLPCGVEVKE